MLILIDHQSEQKIPNQGQALAKQLAGEENSWINPGVLLLHSERPFNLAKPPHTQTQRI